MERKRKRNDRYKGKVLVITFIHLEMASNFRRCGQGGGDSGDNVVTWVSQKVVKCARHDGGHSCPHCRYA